jgi:PAS domain S-box-containing protein
VRNVYLRQCVSRPRQKRTTDDAQGPIASRPPPRQPRPCGVLYVYLPTKGAYGRNVQLPPTAGLWAMDQQTSSSDRLEALLEAGAAALYSCDAAGVITYFNKKATDLWGCAPAPGETEEQFCGQIMSYRADGKYLPCERSPVADILSGKRPGIYDAEVCVKRPDGTQVGVRLSVVPIVDDQGTILGSVSTFRERTPSCLA